ncbi:MAG: response regulator transcription factor [Candidatus Nanopelagicales bacterium]
MLVLLVEDDPAVAAGVRDGLTANGYNVRIVTTGTEALKAAEGLPAPELVLLDLGLPDIDGRDVCRSIRSTSAVPIIVISARDDEVDKVVGLELGADDYLTKPFGIRELIARIRAVLRRVNPPVPNSSTDTTAAQEVGSLSIDRRTQRAYLDDVEISLTNKEFGLLSFLAEDPGAVCRRTEILSEVWETDWYGPTKTVDAHVASLRKKLGNADWIEAVRGVGFRLVEPGASG